MAIDALEVSRYISRSLYITAVSTTLAFLISVPLGYTLGSCGGRAARFFRLLFRSLTALPTIVVGLLVYSLISRNGPLGILGILYSKTAIVIGQIILLIPIIVSGVAAETADIRSEVTETLMTLRAGRVARICILLSEKRNALVTVTVAAWARAMGEIGVSMMLGGNIRQARTVTTAISFEAGRGAFETAMILGLFLITTSLMANFLVYFLAERGHHGR